MKVKRHFPYNRINILILGTIYGYYEASMTNNDGLENESNDYQTNYYSKD